MHFNILFFLIVIYIGDQVKLFALQEGLSPLDRARAHSVSASGTAEAFNKIVAKDFNSRFSDSSAPLTFADHLENMKDGFLSFFKTKPDVSEATMNKEYNDYLSKQKEVDTSLKQDATKDMGLTFSNLWENLSGKMGFEKSSQVDAYPMQNVPSVDVSAQLKTWEKLFRDLTHDVTSGKLLIETQKMLTKMFDPQNHETLARYNEQLSQINQELGRKEAALQSASEALRNRLNQMLQKSSEKAADVLKKHTEAVSNVVNLSDLSLSEDLALKEYQLTVDAITKTISSIDTIKKAESEKKSLLFSLQTMTADLAGSFDQLEKTTPQDRQLHELITSKPQFIEESLYVDLQTLLTKEIATSKPKIFINEKLFDLAHKSGDLTLDEKTRLINDPTFDMNDLWMVSQSWNEFTEEQQTALQKKYLDVSMWNELKLDIDYEWLKQASSDDLAKYAERMIKIQAFLNEKSNHLLNFINISQASDIIQKALNSKTPPSTQPSRRQEV